MNPASRLLSLLFLVLAPFARAADPIESIASLRADLAQAKQIDLQVLPVPKAGDKAPAPVAPRPTLKEFQSKAKRLMAFQDEAILRALLANVATYRPREIPNPSDPAAPDDFSPDVSIGWTFQGRPGLAFINIPAAEVMFFRGREKPLHYGIAPAMMPKLIKSIWGINDKWKGVPQVDSLEDAGKFLISYVEHLPVELLQGLPPEDTQEYQQAKLDAGVRKIDGHAFHAPLPLDAASKAAVAKLFETPFIEPWTGRKEGEIFRPEYALQWGSETRRREIWIDLASSELVLRGEASELRYDLTDPGRQELAKLLLAAQKPAPPPPPADH